MASTSSTGIIDMVGDWYKKAPALPAGAKQFLVTVTPIITLIFGALGVIGGLVGLGVLSFLAPFAYGMTAGYYGLGLVSAIVALIVSAAMLYATPSLFQKKAMGWTVLFWAEVVNIVGSVIGNLTIGNLIWTAVFGAIGFYILFQIRSYYK